MNILRKLLLFIFSSLLLLTLPLNTFAWTTRQTLLDRNAVTSWLYEGRVYENVIDTVAQIAGDNLKTNAGDQMTLDSVLLVKAAKKALPPNTIQQNSESLIYSTYDWLEGKTSKIELNLDLSDEKAAFIDALGDEVTLRAASLPTCSDQQASDFDPLFSNCMPSGTNISNEVNKFKDELSSDDKFLPNTLITGDTLSVGQGNDKKHLSEQLNFAPNIFKNIKSLAIYSGLAVLLLGFLVILLGNKKGSGFRINTWLFGLAGFWNVLIGLLFRFGNSMITVRLTENSELSASTLAISTLIAEVASSIFYWHFIIGGIYIAIAFVCFMASRTKKTNKKQSIKKAEDDIDLKVDEIKEDPKPAPKNREAKKPTLVQ